MKEFRSFLFAFLFLVPFMHDAQAIEYVQSFGGTAVGGGNYSERPEGLLSSQDDGLGFRGQSGGSAYGGGLTYELRINDRWALEIDLLYEDSKFWRYVKINGVDTTEEIVAKNLRIPMIFKINIPVGVGRFNLGVGPEFVRPMSSSASNDRPEDIKAVEVNSTLVTTEIGLNFTLGPNMELGWKLRAGKNLSQGKDISDRVQNFGTGGFLGDYSVKTRNTWEFRMLLGINYLFGDPAVEGLSSEEQRGLRGRADDAFDGL